MALVHLGKLAEGEGIHGRRALLHEHSAIHHQAGARDVTSVVGGEEHGGPGEIVGSSHAPHADHRAARRRSFGGEIVGGNQSPPHRLHPHPPPHLSSSPSNHSPIS